MTVPGVSKGVKERRCDLVGLGFAPFRKGQLTGTFSANGRTAQMGYGLLTRTGQSSRGAGAIWGFTVTVN